MDAIATRTDITVIPFEGIHPRIDPSVFIAAGARIIGDVEIGELSSVWFNVVIRGDVHSITIGRRTNIQDLVMCHVTHRRYPLTIGDDVTVGHSAVLHGAVTREVFTERLVLRGLIGHQVGSLADMRLKNRLESLAGDVGYMERASTALTLDQRNNGVLVAVAATLGLGLFVAPERFVGLNLTAARAENTNEALLHRFADAVRHEPCSLVGNAERAM